MMKKTILLALLYSLLAVNVLAQVIIMEKIELAGGTINVYYTLEDSNPDNQYKVDLYSSKDNFAEPLTKVSGDVGTDIKPGEFHMIKWDAIGEIGGHEGELFLEIRARVYIPFARITGFDEGAKFKRGTTYPLLWSSGNKGGQIDIELYKDQSRISGDRNVPNSGKYEYAIPGSVKPGKNYRLKFTNTRNRDESVYTGYFRIVPKIPMLVKIGALVATAVGVSQFIPDKPGPGTVSTREPLEGPPGFPNN